MRRTYLLLATAAIASAALSGCFGNRGYSEDPNSLSTPVDHSVAFRPAAVPEYPGGFAPQAYAPQVGAQDYALSAGPRQMPRSAPPAIISASAQQTAAQIHQPALAPAPVQTAAKGAAPGQWHTVNANDYIAGSDTVATGTSRLKRLTQGSAQRAAASGSLTMGGAHPLSVPITGEDSYLKAAQKAQMHCKQFNMIPSAPSKRMENGQEVLAYSCGRG